MESKEYGLRLQEQGNDEVVHVTHVDSPLMFYCRLSTEDEQFDLLNDIIKQHVNSNGEQMPELPRPGSSLFLLVFSSIRNCWCRARVISIKVDRKLKPTFVKVFLFDFGSVELVSWKANYVAPSTPLIDGFNDGQSFCFACSLGNIEPPKTPDKTNNDEQNQWSSYTNFVFEKKTKNCKFWLHMINYNPHAKLVICDLIPYREDTEADQTVSQFLVNSNFAQYLVNECVFSFYESEKENICLC